MSALMQSEKAVLSREEAAEFLGISLRMLDALVRTKAIPSRKVGGRRIFVRAKLVAWLDSEEGA